MNSGNLGRLPLTALQSDVCLRSRVTLTAFCIRRTAASASSSARLRVQSFVFILKLLILLKFLIVCHAMPHAYGFAVIPSGMDIPGFAVTSLQVVYLPALYLLRECLYTLFFFEKVEGLREAEKSFLLLIKKKVFPLP